MVDLDARKRLMDREAELAKVLTYGEAERIVAHLRHAALVYKQDGEALRGKSTKLKEELDEKAKDALALAEKVMGLP